MCRAGGLQARCWVFQSFLLREEVEAGCGWFSAEEVPFWYQQEQKRADLSSLASCLCPFLACTGPGRGCALWAIIASWVEPKLKEAWPEGLGLAKGSRYVTHLRRLGTRPMDGIRSKWVRAIVARDSSGEAVASSTLDRA